jgi:hypothetical protein
MLDERRRWQILWAAMAVGFVVVFLISLPVTTPQTTEGDSQWFVNVAQRPSTSLTFWSTSRP